ncbi:hypothetical protein L9F63_028334 [Diploptera punctata]|uniref:Protein amnionless n=1 Tax=Diploptera punctata TaxID=6984 RepID=A0AAD7ZUJ6_DIPPU|nr:hypothetical protein L9F63_028334 [Diploptera punctata]
MSHVQGNLLLEDAVCNMFDRDKETVYQSTPLCINPVKPVGHCCSICGAYLLLDYSTSELSHLHQLLDSFLRQKQYSKVVGHISRPATVSGGSSKTIQIVLTDTEEYRGDCNDLADAFAEKVKQIHKAGHAIAASTWGSLIVIVFSTFVVVVMAMGFIYFFFVGYHQTGWALPNQSFVFARFENVPSESEEATESRVQVLSGDVRELESPSPDSPLAAAFDNPMFGNTKMEERKSLPPAQPGGQVTHENPVYSELKRREEQQKEEETSIGSY